MIEWAETLADLEQARVALLGRKGEITGLMRMMGKIAPEERPILGKRANELRGMAEGLLEACKADLKRADMRARMSSEAVDITLPGARPTLGHQHLINQIIDEIEDVFCGIGYTVEKGPQVETSYYYFTALNAPMDHPSRSARDTFYVADNAPPRHGTRMAGQPESDEPPLQAEARGAALAEAAPRASAARPPRRRPRRGRRRTCAARPRLSRRRTPRR